MKKYLFLLCSMFCILCSYAQNTVMADSITLNKTELEMLVGTTDTLVVTFHPDSVTDKTIVWECWNRDIVDVDSAGVLTALKKGEASIVARTPDWSKQVQCKVKVYTIEVDSIVLNKTEISLMVGEKDTIVATIYPENAMDKEIVWENWNKDVVDIDSAGVVTALKKGEATVLARTQDWRIQVQCKIFVTSNEEENNGNDNGEVANGTDSIPAGWLLIDKYYVALQVGEVDTLNVTVNPENTTDKTLTWTSSADSIVSVDNGVITALAIGQATITAACGDKTVSSNVVVNPVPADSVVIDKLAIVLYVEETDSLVATIFPENASDKEIIWTSYDTTVATVDSLGVVTALKKGETTIVARTSDWKSAECKVTVKSNYADRVNLEWIGNMGIGETKVATATVWPDTIPYKTLTWETSDSTVLLINDAETFKGDTAKVTLKALAKGVATLTVTVEGGAKAECTINVDSIAAGWMLVNDNKYYIPLHIGETDSVSVTVYPDNATDKNVTWTSSADSIVSVSETGVVEALAVGQATIIAISGNASASITVAVCPIIADSVVLDKSAMELIVGVQDTLVANVYPANTTDQTLRWISYNPSVAAVDSMGVVTALSEGNAKIVAVCGWIFSQECEVNVLTNFSDTVYAERLIPNKWYTAIPVGEQDTLSVTVVPTNTTDPTVTWTSSNDSIATVDEAGVVSALAVGTVTITATVGNVSVPIMVAANPVFADSVVIDTTSLELELGAQDSLSVNIYPLNTTDQTVTWISYNPSVVTVDNEGIVTALSEGKATIVAICGWVFAQGCEVTVVATNGEDNNGDDPEDPNDPSYIESVSAGQPIVGTVYTLDGKKVQNTTEGLYIVRTNDGKIKKVMIK